MDQITALTVLAIIYAVSGIIASKTHARISMLFITSVLLLALFWTGMPTTIFNDSGTAAIAFSFIAVLLVHMGSLIDAHQLKDEWKTVIIAFVGMCGGAAGILLIAARFISWDYAVAATGPVSGGVVAGIIMTEAANAKGLTAISVLVTLLLTVQQIVGVPVASNCLIAEGKRLKAKFAAGGSDVSKGAAASSRTYLIPPMPAAWRSDYTYIAQAFILGWLAMKIAPFTNGIVHPFVMALIFGIVAREIGLVEPDFVSKGHASGFVSFVIMTPIFANLAQSTPQMVLSLLGPIAIIFVSALIGIAVFSFVLSKIFGYSWALSMALGSTCLFGFPGTAIVSEEVIAQLGETPEEKEYIRANILPKMLISGFTTVTIASVFLAGFLVKYM